MTTVEEKISPSLGNNKPTCYLPMFGLVAVKIVKEEIKNRSSWLKCRFNLHKVDKKENICFNMLIIMYLEQAPELFFQMITIQASKNR